ncbi:hypothetical protein [Accumulibacter sp.]|uniref:hypothetical protein n=1 Tax=Accumulibacter sp. TaxID=2053492 RepID=UPI0026008E46|nr:hypothetical protein [Accumulibacter sp.]MCP5229156.1 hypothetical protein [Accumulibacter sp.]
MGGRQGKWRCVRSKPVAPGHICRRHDSASWHNCLKGAFAGELVIDEIRDCPGNHHRFAVFDLMRSIGSDFSGFPVS